MKYGSAFAFLLFCFVLSQTYSFAEKCTDFAQSRCEIILSPRKSFVKMTDEPITRVSIADPEIADVRLLTATQLLVIAKKDPGITSLILWHGDERAEVYDVKVVVPGGDLARYIMQAVRQLVPEADLVEVYNAGMGIILSGEVSSIETLDRVLKVAESLIGSRDEITNLMVVRNSCQVQLEVKIAEISHSSMKMMGLGFLVNRDWSIGVLQSGSVAGEAGASRTTEPPTTIQTVNELTGAVTTMTTQGGGVQENISSFMELASPFGSAFQIAMHALNDDALAILSVLKGQGLAKILASPTLVTLSGQKADFLVGGEFPIPVQGDTGQTTIDYRTFGIMLSFTPMVVGRETITIHVEPEVSNVDYSLAVLSGGVSVPGLKTRRGSTTLQLKDGQTFIMAGLLSEDVYQVVNKIPYLSDIPILGKLFTSKEFEKNETELMIVVTPRIVRPLNPDEVPPLPGEAMNNNVSDSDFFIFNKTYSKTNGKTQKEGDIPAAAGRAIKAPVFIGGTGLSH